MIFCVEDDSSTRELMLYALRASGFEAEGFYDSKALFAALEDSRPDLIMLDIMLPGEDGISILERLRASSATAEIPVIMATAKGTEYDKVIGLDKGADDYLVKPFGMMEMVSRVKAVLRRAPGPAKTHVLRLGEIELCPDEHTVTVSGERVQLTLKEYELLLKFMENRGMVFTREQLLSSVWGSDFVGESRTVDVHIGTLRMKLGAQGEHIKTVRGVGYRMEA
jgi:two-component system alkaline phosphatase synthesis response regulator PhoP